jgi:hypothetical protein
VPPLGEHAGQPSPAAPFPFMATEKQIAANRRNAQSSTGPRSAEGKAAASRNALKTGLYCRGIIIGHELYTNLEALEAAFTAEYQPATPTERSLVDSLIHYEWMLRRYRWLETETWHATQDLLTSAQMESTWSGHAFILQPAISRIHRLRNATQRQFRDTVAELRSLQAERAAAPPPHPPEPDDPQPNENTSPDSEIGFVSSNCENDPPFDPFDRTAVHPPDAPPACQTDHNVLNS